MPASKLRSRISAVGITIKTRVRSWRTSCANTETRSPRSPKTWETAWKTSLDLVSIIIVAYNNWPELENAIQSALCQSYSPREVIVVDNSSSDETPAEVEKLFGSRVRYVRQANRGDAGAYNAGFQQARG